MQLIMSVVYFCINHICNLLENNIVYLKICIRSQTSDCSTTKVQEFRAVLEKGFTHKHLKSETPIDLHKEGVET